MSAYINIGGQAVLEGVMMRAPKSMSVAVRLPGGEIVLKKDSLKLLADRFRFLRLPVLRGTVTLFSSLALGIRALNFSAEQAIEAEESKKSGEADDAAPAGSKEKKEGIGGTDIMLYATVAFSLVLGLGLFFYLPLWLTEMSRAIIPSVDDSALMFNMVDGLIRITVFLMYIVGISFMPDIRRVFEYHGAEHKAIFAYESGADVTVDSARSHPRIHPRCGTSFLLVVMVLSIMVFSFVPNESSFYVKALARLVFIPVIAGLSYEFIRYTGKHMDNTFVRTVAAPGLWLQKITTREPSDDQIEVAIAALKEALRMERDGNREEATA
jgi:uncharacterized protein YqhQ